MTTTNRIETLVTTHTAFSSLAEMAHSMARGYVPTLRTSPSGHSRAAKALAAEVAELAAALKAAGHKVFEI